MTDETDIIRVIAIKGEGDSWELDVLGVPYGGPINGRDRQGEYFSERTNLYDDIITPIVTYIHGLEEFKSQTPQIIGRVEGKPERRTDGVWYRVVLDKTSEFAKRVWEAAKTGLARASSGSVAHLVRKTRAGEITSWPIAELTLLDSQPGVRRAINDYAIALPVMKARYESAGGLLPEIPDQPDPEPEDEGAQAQSVKAAVAVTEQPTNTPEEIDMDEIQKTVQDAVAAALKAEREAQAAEAAKKSEIEAAKAEAVKAAKGEWEAEAAKHNRLPFNQDLPNIHKYGELRQFDNLDAADMGVLIGVLDAQVAKGGKRASEAAYKALALKAEAEAEKTVLGHDVTRAMKAVGMKSDEIDYSTLASYGDEWVGVAYSQAIWDAIRVGTFVANKLPSVELAQGVESIYLPLESTDPVFYKVAENTTYDSTMKTPVATVTSSRLGTGRVQLTLAKMGGRTLWSGEMGERSLIPFVNQLRMQLATSGAQYLEAAIVDGDTTTTATTNINDIAATGTQAGTEYYMLFNGFRKSPLVTTTANSRSAGGALAASDFLATVKLMGGAAINALDHSKVSFVVDPLTHFKALELPEVKTRDVFVSSTIETGRLTGIYGYGLDISGFMNFSATNRLSNTAGKVDQDVVGNNAYGSILAVRWDQWKLGYQRRMTLETSRWPESDTNQIVCMFSVGLIQRDTEASAISYYVGV